MNKYEVQYAKRLIVDIKPYLGDDFAIIKDSLKKSISIQAQCVIKLQDQEEKAVVPPTAIRSDIICPTKIIPPLALLSD